MSIWIPVYMDSEVKYQRIRLNVETIGCAGAVLGFCYERSP
jgi:hypothetical protein